MVAAYVADLERLVSKPRLDRYRSQNGDDLETAVAYLVNIALAEALLQGLSAVEVALRNSIHNAFTNHAGTDQWFWAMLQQRDLAIVNEKWAKIAYRRKAPPEPGRVIAELTFGFWPYLFEQRYHKHIWWANHAALFKAVFPHLPTNVPPHQLTGQGDVYQRLKLFVDLRNRVMHHEPVLFGVPRPDLGTPPPVIMIDTVHRQMVEMLNWIDPQHALTLSFIDRFPDVFQNEQARIRATLMAHFGVP